MTQHNFYTYAHFRKDNGEIFYIGKGQGRRHKVKQHRNKAWNNIINKFGYTTEILARWKTEQEAFDHEVFLISCFNNLTNHYPGGPFRGYTGKMNPMYGKVSAMKGKKQTPLGLKSIIDRANSPKNRVVFEKVACPHCGKESNLGNAKRWHFDNCKHKN